MPLYFLSLCLLLLSELDLFNTEKQYQRVSTDDQPLAFPGAEGFGRYTTGGRGGAVLIVDKLSDYPTRPEAGSLRWAINQKGPRTIVFGISGTIELAAPLNIRYGDLTIAGQSAPGDGVCLKNYVTSVNASNVIIRYLRFRCGIDTEANAAQDALNGTKQEQVIIDHCSMSWSVDEAASFYDNRNFTLQWCIISESLYASGHEKGEHGYGGIWGGMGASFHHNLIAHHTSRNPRFNGARFSTTSETELVDFRNNVIYNWGFNSIYGGEGGRQNIVNNYFKPGPATRSGEVQYRILDLTQKFFDKKINPDTVYAGSYFIEGNLVEGHRGASKDNWGMGVQRATEEQKKKSFRNQLFAFAPIVTVSAEDALQAVLGHAGAVLPKRDRVDQRIVEEVRTGKCAGGGKYGAATGIIDTPERVGGWPELRTYNTRSDADKDGMPDDWERSRKLNPNNPSDATQTSIHPYYTNIEIYLNQLGT